MIPISAFRRYSMNEANLDAVNASVHTLFVGVLVVVLAAGCDSGPDRGKKVELPPPASTTMAPETPNSTGGAATQSSDEQAVRDSYTAYWPMVAALGKVPNNELRGHLKDYFAEPYLTEQIKAIIYQRVFKTEVTGEVVPHITSVKVSGEEAVVRDCADASGVVVRNKKNPSLNQRGQKNRDQTMTLARGKDGVWRTKKLVITGKPC